MSTSYIQSFFQNLQPKKTLIVSSLKNHNNKKEILKDIESFFDDEENYLNIDSNIYVGRKPKGPRLNKNNEIIPYSYVGDPHFIRKSLLKKAANNPKKLGNQSHRTYESAATILKKKGNEFDIVNGKMLHNLYLDMRNQTERNKNKINDEILNQLPELIKDQLISQEKNLKDYELKDKKAKTMENYLIKKTNKQRDQLLMTNIDSFQFKNAILNTINDKTPNEIKLGDNSWYYNLRRPKNFKGIRDCYINIRTNENPFWGRFFEKYPNPVLKCRKPMMNKKYLKSFENNPYIPSIPLGSSTLKEMSNMSNLIVKGRNLCDFERHFESKIPGKKRLYKRNQLETMEESKYLTGPEFEKYLHEITEDHTYADNFDVREMYKNLSGKSPMMSASMNSTVF